MYVWLTTIVSNSVGGAPITETFTIDNNNASLPSTSILVTTALQQVNQQGSNGQAQVAITSYVQNGDAFEGSWPLLSGENFTSVTFSLTVTNALAGATGVIVGIN